MSTMTTTTPQALGWMSVGTAPAVRLTSIGTLGPAGTSSEQAAGLLWRELGEGPPVVRLFNSYEQGADAVRDGHVSHFVVANAYRDAHGFYMDLRLSLASVFIMDTPLYGLARRPGVQDIPARPTVASHRSPVPLIHQLMPAGLNVGDIEVMSSTSAAAQAARNRLVDLALTTEVAARNHGLEFVSATRPIRMVWSVFVAGGGGLAGLTGGTREGEV